MRIARTAALSRLKTSAICHRPKTKRQHGDFGDDDQVIGVIDEPIRPAPDQRRAGHDDDPRRPALPERAQHPDAGQLEQHEQDEQKRRRSAGRAPTTTKPRARRRARATMNG